MTAAVRHRSEAAIEALVLRELGRTDRLLLLKNEVCVGYRGALLPALQAALQPFGRDVVEAAVAVTQRHRLTFGLGKGSPDLVGALDGRAFCLELKSATGSLSEDQKIWHRAARRRGVFVATVRDVAEAVEAVSRARAGGVE